MGSPATPEAVPALASDTGLVESIEVVASPDDDAVERARGTTLGSVELERLPARTLAEALEELPGVAVLFASPFGGVPMVLARGYFGGGEIDHVGLEVDGAPRAEIESGVVDWGAVALPGVGRLDYLPGASLRRGGVDPALAGLVRLTSADATDSDRYAAELAAAGFASHAASFAARSDELFAAALSSALSGDWSETGGYREHSAAEGHGAELGLELPLAESRFAFDAWGRSRNREEPGPLSESELADDPLASNPLFSDDRERSDRWGAALRFDRASPALPFSARLDFEGRRSSFLRTLLVAEGYGDRARRELETEAQAAGIATPAGIPEGRRYALRGALDLRNERVSTAYSDPGNGAPTASERARRRRGALEFGGALLLAPGLELDASVRGDRVDDRAASSPALERKQALSPRIGLVYDTAVAAGALELFAEVSRAFRVASLDQIYDPRPFAGPDGGFTISNPALQPQKSRGFELGGRLAGEPFAARLVAYRQIVVDEIDFDPASFRYGNIGRSRHEGFELALSTRIERWGSLRASWARARVFAEGESKSGQLKNLPEDIVRLGWSARLPAAIELELTWGWLAGRFADDANTRPLADAHRLDLRLQRRFPAWRIALDLLNALDDDALELAFLLPGAEGGETLHGYAPAPRAVRLTLATAWGGRPGDRDSR